MTDIGNAIGKTRGQVSMAIHIVVPPPWRGDCTSSVSREQMERPIVWNFDIDNSLNGPCRCLVCEAKKLPVEERAASLQAALLARGFSGWPAEYYLAD